jgi:DNA-binding transcriptional regulator YiaG
MPNIAAALRDEVTRLARKEIRASVGPLRTQVAEQRRTIAALRRELDAVKRELTFLNKQEQRRLEVSPEPEEAEGVRFSPKWVAADRKRLGLSAKDYGRLVGVSGLTIYNWESGKSKPRAKALAGWAAVRGIGKREARRRLELVG